MDRKMMKLDDDQLGAASGGYYAAYSKSVLVYGSPVDIVQMSQSGVGQSANGNAFSLVTQVAGSDASNSASVSFG